MEYLLAIIVGIGLAASTGFRVFVPLLVVSVAVNAGYFEVAENLRWLGTWTALVAFAVAASVEIAAYYVPWIDNLLDVIASPIAVIAGSVLFAASVGGFNPFWQWSLAVIAGGGSAAIVQGASVVTRAASTTATGGLANFVVSTLETLAGVFFSVMSIALPLLALVLLIVVVGSMYYVGRQVLQKLVASQGKAVP